PDAGAFWDALEKALSAPHIPELLPLAPPSPHVAPAPVVAHSPNAALRPNGAVPAHVPAPPHAAPLPNLPPPSVLALGHRPSQSRHARDIPPSLDSSKLMTPILLMLLGG